jgi:hypothetical protein
MTLHFLPPALDAYDAAVDEATDACNGDPRGALKALIIANEFLERAPAVAFHAGRDHANRCDRSGLAVSLDFSPLNNITYSTAKPQVVGISTTSRWRPMSAICWFPPFKETHATPGLIALLKFSTALPFKSYRTASSGE